MTFHILVIELSLFLKIALHFFNPYETIMSNFFTSSSPLLFDVRLHRSASPLALIKKKMLIG